MLTHHCRTPTPTPGPKQIIIGKWEWVDVPDNFLDFHKDGTTTGSIFSDKPVPGEYQWEDENHLVITWNLSDISEEENAMSIPLAMTFEIKDLSEDSLEMISQGNVYIYTKVVD